MGSSSLRAASAGVGSSSLRNPSKHNVDDVGKRSLRHRSVDDSSRVSDGSCAAVLPKRVMRQSHLPFLEARISKRGVDDGDVEALEVLIQSASKRGCQKRLDVSNSRSGPGDEKKCSCKVDFGGLEFVKFEMSLELAERAVVKRIGPREEAPRPISTTLQAHVYSSIFSEARALRTASDLADECGHGGHDGGV